MFLSKAALLPRPGLQTHIRLAAIATIEGHSVRVSSTSFFPHYRSKPTLGTATFSTNATSGPPGGPESPDETGSSSPPGGPEPPDETGSLCRKDLGQEIAKTHGLSVAQSNRIVKTVFDTITHALEDDRRVKVANFGAFDSYTAKTFNGRNPKNGEPIVVPAKKRIRFKAYTSLRKSVSKDGEV